MHILDEGASNNSDVMIPGNDRLLVNAHTNLSLCFFLFCSILIRKQVKYNEKCHNLHKHNDKNKYAQSFFHK